VVYLVGYCEDIGTSSLHAADKIQVFFMCSGWLNGKVGLTLFVGSILEGQRLVKLIQDQLRQWSYLISTPINAHT